MDKGRYRQLFLDEAGEHVRALAGGLGAWFANERRHRRNGNGDRALEQLEARHRALLAEIERLIKRQFEAQSNALTAHLLETKKMFLDFLIELKGARHGSDSCR